MNPSRPSVNAKRIAEIAVVFGLVLVMALTRAGRPAENGSFLGGSGGARGTSEPRRSEARARDHERPRAEPAAAPEAERPLTIKVVDMMSGRSIEDVNVTWRNGRAVAEEVELGKTDEEGRVSTKVPIAANDVIGCRSSVRTGSRGFDVEVTESAFDRSVNVLKIAITLYAEIVVRVTSPVPRAKEVLVTVVPFPDLSKFPLSDPNERRALEAMRFDPESLVSALERRKIFPYAFKEIARIPRDKDETTIYVPWDGDVRVGAIEDTILPAVARTTVGRGSSSLVTLAMTKPPMVRGMLLDPDGNPAPDREVVVRFQSVFCGNEIVPRMAGQARAGGVTMIGDLTDPECRARVVMSRLVQSDANGRFATSVNYTDYVTAWSLDDSLGVACATKDVDGRSAECADMTLRFRGIAPGDHRCLVLTKTGFPGRGRAYRLAEAIDRPGLTAFDMDDSIQYPELIADDDGFIDCRFLTEGKQYEVQDTKNGGAPIRFTYRPGLTIRS